ncbi:hypothetical protein [Paenibacillus koleovorans]|uniref:hypothetical protein n=1 Tax=Paenibacillus koleovorans TaxID=121608 RepID=UPI000FDC1E1D|nr:hypothetical protein [Paenibacillus koleovorans]
MADFENREGYEAQDFSDQERARNWERQRIWDVEQRHNEEFATDFAPEPVWMARRHAETADEDGYSTSSSSQSGSRTWGWVALACSLLALFVWPVWLGGAAVVLGLIAFMRGARALGGWSILIGGIAILAFVVLIPYYA